MGSREPRAEAFGGCVVILVGRGGGILIRPPGDHGETALALPGATARDGETPRETALRAALEATGVDLERMRYFQPLASNGGTAPVHVYFADDAIDGLDVREARFVAPSEIDTLPMDPGHRDAVRAFVAHDFYRGMVALQAPVRRGASVLALDRWGRVLLQLRDDDLPPERFPGQWSLAGGLIEPHEPPDAAAIREFEEETGQVLEDLRFFRTYRRGDLPAMQIDAWHIYFCDPDIPEEAIDVREGQAFRYYAPAELGRLTIPLAARRILDDFLVSPAYSALFH